MELVFLGTGAACGVPTYYCGCKACKEALANPRCVRTRSSLAICGNETILIDASPDLWTQLNRERISHVEHLFLTHWHYDHFGGLGELEFFVRLVRKQPLPAYMTPETWNSLLPAFGYMADCFEPHLLQPADTVQIGSLRITPLGARHAPGTIGLLMENSRAERTAYLPDTGPLPGETALRLEGVDALILDATFWGTNWLPTEHHSVEEAIQTGMALDAGMFYLTHLALHYDQPTTSQELETMLSVHGGRVRLAYDGDRLELGR